MSNLEYQKAGDKTAVGDNSQRHGLTAGDTWSRQNQNTFRPSPNSEVAQSVLPPDPFGNIDAQVAQLITQEKQVTLYGVPAIEKHGTTYLLGEASNVPNVTKGIQNLDDAQALGGAMINAAVDGTVSTLNSWSQSPEVMNNGLLSVGPALDNAVNYYSSTSFDQVGKDAQTAIGAIGKAVDDNLGRPITIKEQGQHIEYASLFFLPGQLKPVEQTEAKLMGLEKLTQEELEAKGIKKVADLNTRLITQDTFGVENLETFQARMSMKDGLMKFDIDYMLQPQDKPRPNMFQVFNRIVALAKENGATELEVRWQELEPGKFDPLLRRYNAVHEKIGDTDIIRFKFDR